MQNWDALPRQLSCAINKTGFPNACSVILLSIHCKVANILALQIFFRAKHFWLNSPQSWRFSEQSIEICIFPEQSIELYAMVELLLSECCRLAMSRPEKIGCAKIFANVLTMLLCFSGWVGGGIRTLLRTALQLEEIHQDFLFIFDLQYSNSIKKDK